MAQRIDLGVPQGLKVRLEWPDLAAAPTAADATRGGMLLWVAEELVWGRETDTGLKPFEWTWIELLEFLTYSWAHLVLEEDYPLGLRPENPLDLRNRLRIYLQDIPEELHEEEENEVFEFEERHDLARGLQGIHLPPVWLVREGDAYWIATTNQCILRPTEEVLDFLASLGDAIGDRVSLADDERARDAVEAWKQRKALPQLKLAEAATGLSPTILNEVATFGDLFDQVGYRGEYRPTEILAVARMMSGALSPADLKTALRVVTAVGKVVTEKLDALSDQAEQVVDVTRPGKPWSEGHRLAAWFRKQLGLEGDVPVNPAAILSTFGVLMDDIDIVDDRLDAIACWGPRHGPAVIVNTRGRHSQGSAGRRSTLAHEICHLLIDRRGALPVSEVLNGRAPWRVEARARAFAAELLLPRSVAAKAVNAVDDITVAANNLRERYGVSHELVAWQIRNSGVHLTPDQRLQLRPMVSDPDSF
jgi:Zn-dependent peptidase ImmA (M78 family)